MNYKNWLKVKLISFLQKTIIYPLLTRIPKGTVSVYSKRIFKKIYFFVDPNSPKMRKTPLFLEPALHWKFDASKTIFPEQNFVIKVKNWSVWGNQGCVVTDCGGVLREVSREFDSDTHSIFKQLKLIKPIKIQGNIAVVAASGANVYYHWMIDILPRIQLLKDAGLFEKIDKFILNYQGLPFQKESLLLLGIKESDIIISTNHWGFHAKMDNLIIPSFTSPLDMTSKYSIDFLRNTFMNEDLSEKYFEKIYLKRINGRKIMNVEEVETYLISQGFETIILENYTIIQQAALFNNAKFIIGAHGAGFTNLVFCKPHTKVIDIFAPTWVNPCYWTIACDLDLDYAYLIGEGTKPIDMFDPKGKGDNILVDIEKLKNIISQIHWIIPEK